MSGNWCPVKRLSPGAIGTSKMSSVLQTFDRMPLKFRVLVGELREVSAERSSQRALDVAVRAGGQRTGPAKNARTRERDQRST
jgi:hypothetical protein